MEFKHVPVLLNQVLDGLNLKPNKTYVDATLGGAGHSSEILEKAKGSRLIGIDQDDEAINASRKRLKSYGDRVIFRKDNFKNLKTVLEDLQIDKVYGILADLGVSSHQIDDPARGFSFRFDSMLDMRMDKSNPLTALKVVNEYSEASLKQIIKEYGEERFASSIAKKIVLARKKGAIVSTKQLEEIVLSSVPRYRGNDGSSSVQRTFQAIRIEVNGELKILADFIKDAVSKLEPKGRLAIISFHSLEDRIVKHTFKELATGCTCPSDFPICVCGKKPIVKIITPHPIVADEEEIKINSRSSSAKLRIVEKI